MAREVVVFDVVVPRLVLDRLADEVRDDDEVLLRDDELLRDDDELLPAPLTPMGRSL